MPSQFWRAFHRRAVRHARGKCSRVVAAFAPPCFRARRFGGVAGDGFAAFRNSSLIAPGLSGAALCRVPDGRGSIVRARARGAVVLAIAVRQSAGRVTVRKYPARKRRLLLGSARSIRLRVRLNLGGVTVDGHDVLCSTLPAACCRCAPVAGSLRRTADNKFEHAARALVTAARLPRRGAAVRVLAAPSMSEARRARRGLRCHAFPAALRSSPCARHARR